MKLGVFPIKTLCFTSRSAGTNAESQLGAGESKPFECLVTRRHGAPPHARATGGQHAHARTLRTRAPAPSSARPHPPRRLTVCPPARSRGQWSWVTVRRRRHPASAGRSPAALGRRTRVAPPLSIPTRRASSAFICSHKAPPAPLPRPALPTHSPQFRHPCCSWLDGWRNRQGSEARSVNCGEGARRWPACSPCPWWCRARRAR